MVSNRNGEKGDNHRLASTRLLTRVIVFVRMSKIPVNVKLIKENCLCNNLNKIKDALNWLVNNHILIKNKDNGNNVYYTMNEDGN